MMKTTFAIALLPHIASLAAAAATDIKFTFLNKCPEEINVYHRSKYEFTLQSGESKDQAGFDDAHMFYTNRNGGDPYGDHAMSFGTYANKDHSYYLILKGPVANTGLSIEPSKGCKAISCDSLDCKEGFDEKNKPAFIANENGFPPAGGLAPEPPLYHCPGQDVHYKFTFCPSGQFPNGLTSHPVHIRGNDKKCLHVKDHSFADGTPVEIHDCDNGPAQQWVLDKGLTQVRLAGTKYCLDRGQGTDEDVRNGKGVDMKIWTCDSKLQQQQWIFDYLNRITYYGVCLDLKDGVTINGNLIQAWKCFPENANQIWDLGAASKTK